MSFKSPYKIVVMRYWHDTNDLSERVCDQMRNVWQPIGGPFYSNDDEKRVLAQAMVYVGNPEDFDKRIESVLT